MAPHVKTTTASTRVRRVLRWLFPSRRTVLVDAAVEVAAALLGLPAPLHVVIGLAAHFVFALLSLDRSRGATIRN
jgi:hypothetical protein